MGDQTSNDQGIAEQESPPGSKHAEQLTQQGGSPWNVAQNIIGKNRVKLCVAKTQGPREITDLELGSFGHLARRGELVGGANARLVDVYTQHAAFNRFRDL